MQQLSAQNFREVDEETRCLLIVLAGEAAETRGYVFFSEVQFIPEADLKAIDDLWRHTTTIGSATTGSTTPSKRDSPPPHRPRRLLIILAAVKANKTTNTTGGFKGLMTDPNL
ncbi:hypothetical protein M0R45_010945 [Rubus argutus]|uniref:GUN4-like domain-containing protein n=1 Tax=Rubus argutus TaxID=59490 RepID=A0AAW1Y8J9_RUBAR